MEEQNTGSCLSVSGSIDVRSYDVASLRETVDDWDSLDEWEQYLVVQKPENLDLEELTNRERELAELAVQPSDCVDDHNTTCVGMHEYFVRNLDGSIDENQIASHLALGTDGTSGAASSDRALNNEVYRSAIDDWADNGTELLCSVYLSSSEANGNDIDELGLFSDDGSSDNIMFNHSTFNAVTKDSTEPIVFNVTLSFDSA